jgi:hypothetical protein
MAVKGEPEGAIEATDALQVLDPSGIPSALIIRSTDPFKVAAEFKILSGLVPLGLLSYQVKYFAESIGPGTAYGPFTVSKKTVVGQTTYNATTPTGNETVHNISAGTLADGVYQLGAMVTFKLDPGGGVAPTPYPMTVYVAGPSIEVYT